MKVYRSEPRRWTVEEVLGGKVVDFVSCRALIHVSDRNRFASSAEVHVAERNSVDSTMVAEDTIRKIGKFVTSPSIRMIIPPAKLVVSNFRSRPCAFTPRRRRTFARMRLSGRPR